MFYGDIESNIRLHAKDMTDTEVREAAEFVQANNFIEKLPNAYKQKVTERGSTFSSGRDNWSHLLVQLLLILRF